MRKTNNIVRRNMGRGNDAPLEKPNKPGFPTALGNRRRDSHIATATTAATLFQNFKPERIILVAFSNPSGSSFDWKRLRPRASCECSGSITIHRKDSSIYSLVEG
jgi:hypothetical protein